MFAKCFEMAMSSVLNNKMRSALTMLGIVIGVTAVIALTSLMSGLTGTVTEAFEDMGMEAISVIITSRASTKTLPIEDVEELMNENPDVIAGYSPAVSMSAYLKDPEDNSVISTTATGINEQYLSLKNYNVQYGRELTYIDVERQMKVCIIGTYVAQNMFGGDALGQTLQISGTPYTVVGIIEEQDDSTEGSSDDIIYVPYTLAMHTTKTNTISSYVIYATSQDTVEEAEDLIEAMCYAAIGDEDYYTIVAMKSVADSLSDILERMEIMLIAIAGISLVVAGIGIMNIMLVSVTERTREIGIRKALGAKQRSILTQFVIEAGMLSCVGGVVGIVLGSILAIVAGQLLGMTVLPTAFSIVISFSVSTAIGVFFGFMPARKAAVLNPIDALRYD